LRHPLTPPEKELWRRLRDHQLGLHIRRQHVLLGRYIADFYCAEARLCIEVDGDSHAEPDQVEYDAVRTRALETDGYRVIRFANRDIFSDLEGVVATIAQACERYTASPNAPPRGGS
jgi:very-short-patch-repair endonuclease